MVEAAGADPCDSMSQEQIKEYLTEMAERHIAARESYTSKKSDAAKEYYIWMGQESGVDLSVTMIKAPGLTIDDFRAHFEPEVFPANMTAQEDALTCRKLDDNIGEGMFAMYQHIKTPMVVSNRCVFQSVRQWDLENGGII